MRARLIKLKFLLTTYPFRYRLMIWTRRLFWSEKVFTGRYADCLIDTKKWAKEHDIIIIKLSKEKLGVNDETIRKSRKHADSRLYCFTVYYVSDTQLTRLLGYNETYDHIQLT